MTPETVPAATRDCNATAKDGSRVVHRHGIDDDALDFGQRIVDINPGYSQAYVIDICRTEED